MDERLRPRIVRRFVRVSRQVVQLELAAAAAGYDLTRAKTTCKTCGFTYSSKKHAELCKLRPRRLAHDTLRKYGLVRGRDPRYLVRPRTEGA